MRKVIIELTHDQLAKELDLPSGVKVCEVGSTEFGKNTFKIVLGQKDESKDVLGSLAADVDANPRLSIPAISADDIVGKGLEKFEIW